MKVRDLLAKAGPDAEIAVSFSEAEDEIAIEPLFSDTVTVEWNKGARRIVIDIDEYFYDIFDADSDQ